jgi:hypothetical protein
VLSDMALVLRMPIVDGQDADDRNDVRCVAQHGSQTWLSTREIHTSITTGAAAAQAPVAALPGPRLHRAAVFSPRL